MKYRLHISNKLSKTFENGMTEILNGISAKDLPNGTFIRDEDYCDWVVLDHLWVKHNDNKNITLSHFDKSKNSNVYVVTCKKDAAISYTLDNIKQQNEIDKENENENEKEHDYDNCLYDIKTIVKKKGRPKIKDKKFTRPPTAYNIFVKGWMSKNTHLDCSNKEKLKLCGKDWSVYKKAL